MTWKTLERVGLCAIRFTMFVVFAGPAGSSVACAQVAEKLLAAKTISFDSVITSTADGKSLRKSREYFMSPGKSRHELLFPESEAGGFAIEDFVAGKSIAVISKTKTALVGSIKGGAELDRIKRMIDFLRSLPEKNPRQLGERQIEGVPVKGFELDSPAETTTVWAHATTGSPVRIEILHKNAQPGPPGRPFTTACVSGNGCGSHFESKSRRTLAILSGRYTREEGPDYVLVPRHEDEYILRRVRRLED